MQVHFEVWSWPDGGAPMLPPDEESDGPPVETTTQFPDGQEAYLNGSREAAEALLNAWREEERAVRSTGPFPAQGAESKHRLVKVTTEVLEG